MDVPVCGYCGDTGWLWGWSQNGPCPLCNEEAPEEGNQVVKKWHPLAEKFPLLAGAEMEQFKASIERDGVQQPIVYRMVDEEKQYLDGRNRDTAAAELGLPCPEQLVQVHDDDVEQYILNCNIHRRQMDKDTRLSLVAELRGQGKTVREIAAATGTSTGTAGRDVQAVEEKPDGGSVPNGTEEPQQERQPGEDPEEPAKEPKKKGKKKPKNGSPLVDWNGYLAALGVLARLPDVVAKAYPGERNGADATEIGDMLDKLTEKVQGWKRLLLGTKKKGA